MLLACAHCGLCLPSCPTYRELSMEMDSPRGRIYIMRALVDGRLPVDEKFAEHIYRCLVCRACETACPSGIHYSRLIEEAREVFEKNFKRPLSQRILQNFVFKRLFPNQKLLGFTFWMIWLYQRLGIRWLARNLGIMRLMGRMGEAEKILPNIPSPLLKYSLKKVIPPEGERKHRLGFFPGCMMIHIFPSVNLATARVLAENGCEVITPQKQQCCGALHTLSGIKEPALRLARQNIDIFEKIDVEAIIVNCAGCGAALREYSHLLADDPDYAEKAENFSRRVKDISEFLAEIEVKPPQGEIVHRVTYDDPCHLLHGQKVKEQPRMLLQSIPGLELVELKQADRCCGSAGVYNVLQPEMSMRLLEDKMKNIAETNAEIVVTGNPGCLIQIGLGVKQHNLNMRVMHTVELLDLSYRSRDATS
ncbi:TPA: 4Fe-4S dicluster domain-containing protein [Candidatus Poribacteria bacterium]|nr:4Fe-4S dicluster domain-containing protein [Candidatus Poribacteria bacterium]